MLIYPLRNSRRSSVLTCFKYQCPPSHFPTVLKAQVTFFFVLEEIGNIFTHWSSTEALQGLQHQRQCHLWFSFKGDNGHFLKKIKLVEVAGMKRRGDHPEAVELGELSSQLLRWFPTSTGTKTQRCHDLLAAIVLAARLITAVPPSDCCAWFRPSCPLADFGAAAH